MSQVALISQTLRAGHCHAYMNSADGEKLIVTSNPSAFADFEFDNETRLIAVNPPPELLPATTLALTRVFRSMLARARTGSRVGRTLERSAKRLARRVRPYDRSGERAAEGNVLDGNVIRISEMYLRLAEEHFQSPIDRLVVFDIFDLPVALAFAKDHDIEVLVR